LPTIIDSPPPLDCEHLNAGAGNALSSLSAGEVCIRLCRFLI
jgi:hypothetical protein